MIMNRDTLMNYLTQTTFQRFTASKLPVELCETLVSRLTTQE